MPAGALGLSIHPLGMTVRIAFFADIHANRQAFSASHEQARRRGAERFVFLGDCVGYGADPEWTVRAVMDLVDQGATAIRGNHDNAVGDPRERMNAAALMAIEWTRGILGAPERKFLETLPIIVRDGDRLYVHSEASDPTSWKYVTSATDAARSLDATTASITFCGHIHLPALYTRSSTGKMTSFTPTTDAPIELLSGRQWLAVLGSVGQPRDGNPAASYALLDTARNELTYCRAPYDVEAAAAKIRINGLPPWFADRLALGR